MNKALLFLSLGLVLALALRSQSLAELNAKYPVVTSYEVRSGILMTPKYSAEGQVCQMSIERQRGTRSGIMFDSFISDKLVKQIVDELAPRSERGEPRFGREDVVGIVTTGGMTRNMHEYENIDFDVMDGPNRERVVVISWKSEVQRRTRASPTSAVPALINGQCLVNAVTVKVDFRSFR
jgi:hypothetical protein